MRGFTIYDFRTVVMKRVIVDSLNELIEALEKGLPMTASEGEWEVEGWFTSTMRRLFRRSGVTVAVLADEFVKLLDQTEKYSIYFTNGEGAAEQRFAYQKYIQASELILEKLSTFTAVRCIKSNQCLQSRLLALKYRLEQVNGGVSPQSVQQASVNLLKAKVLDWKKNYEVLANDEKVLTERDLLQIQTTSQYPGFVDILNCDEEIFEAYMLWTFRDGNLARIFIEYPHLQEKLVESHLNGRIGRISEKDLKIVKRDCADAAFEKVVTLPFEGVDINILNPDQRVGFKGNYWLTVDEVFKIFRDKTYFVGNLEYLAHGVTNWNAHQWGHWDADSQSFIKIDLNHAQWWEQLPVFEICTQTELMERYKKALNGDEWVVAATATRGSRTLDYENTHAFLEVAIPWGEGRFAIYDFGKFAMKFPSSFFEGISIFCHNLHATVAYPDENVFYSHREQTYHAYTISQESGLELMRRIKEDMVKSQRMNFVYQIESDNCAIWVYHHLEGIFGVGTLPNLFRMPLLETEPHTLVAKIFSFIKKLPQRLQIPTLMGFHYILGASKETWIVEGGHWVCKSLTRHIFWQTGEVYLPALLHKKVEEGVLKSFDVRKSLNINNICLFIRKKFDRYKVIGVPYFILQKAFFEFFAPSTPKALMTGPPCVLNDRLAHTHAGQNQGTMIE